MSAIQGAAIVSLYSALVVVPWYFWMTPEPLPHAARSELLWQILWQGVLNGCVALFALSQAITRLGAERSSSMVAFVPVLSAILALVFLGEIPSSSELAAFVAISAGVSLGVSRGYAGNPASINAPMKRPA